MAKLAFSKLGLTKKQDVVEAKIGDNTIEVSQYLDVALKSALINAAVRGAVIKGVVDEILMDAYLHVLIVENYTNISFTPKQKEAVLDTFDILQSNGTFNSIIANLAPDEYDYIFSSALKLAQSLNEYNRSVISLTENMDDIMERISSNFTGQTQ
jgi:hypothetical protein